MSIMDKIDLKILNIMQNNARISNAEISRILKMAPSAILERIRKLEDKGVITGYETRLNPKILNHGLAAFIFVRETEGKGDWQTAEQLAKLPEVLEVHHVAGEDCLLVKVRTRDTDHLEKLLKKDFAAIDSLISTRTTIVLSTTKESTSLPLNGEE
ncbi:MAG: Lrp/AsnC family transcriptional regulator [Candidatus Marinimicrobia bacterium]|nr:Lrp/AsnC family transcriptional regulator [Candidatus Neomarinimicrobiota bacterium]